MCYYRLIVNLGILTFSFSKTDDPNLRAGRYYAFKNDAFVAIGNVYDLTLKSPQNLGWIFPGHIIISDLFIDLKLIINENN